MDSMALVFEWIQHHPAMVTLITLASVGLALLYAGLVIVVMVRIRSDYFVQRQTTIGDRKRLWFSSAIIVVARNVAGWILLLVGIVLLVLPGQGILTVLMGLALLDFPGKRALLLRILRIRRVHQAIGRIRAKAGKPPLVIPAD